MDVPLAQNSSLNALVSKLTGNLHSDLCRKVFQSLIDEQNRSFISHQNIQVQFIKPEYISNLVFERVNFFTPIIFTDQFSSLKHRFLEKVDSYFYLGSLFNQKAAKVYALNQITKSYLCDEAASSSNHFMTALKIMSYATILMPTLALIAKIALRSTINFEYATFRFRI